MTNHMGRRVVLAALLLVGVVAAAPGRGRAVADPLKAEILRWTRFVESHPSGDQDWMQVRLAVQPVLANAQSALKDGRRWLALHRLAAAQEKLAAFTYGLAPGGTSKGDAVSLAAEWKRVGSMLAPDLAPSPRAFDDVRPAVVRAFGETALAKVREYYKASRDYGENTTAESGIYYLGVAQGEHDFAAFCRRLSEPSTLREPRLRSLDGELNALRHEMLLAYRPPASMDNHRQFIGASSLLKEARELNEAGLRHAALLRYLQAWQRFHAIPSLSGSAYAPADIRARIAPLRARLSNGGVDHTMGQLFVEDAESELVSCEWSPTHAASAAASAGAVERYFEAIAPGQPGHSPAAPLLTVTLVRWPFT